MKIYNQPVELIIDAPAGQAKSFAPATDIKAQLEKGDVPVEKIIRRNASVPANKNVTAKVPAHPGNNM